MSPGRSARRAAEPLPAVGAPAHFRADLHDSEPAPPPAHAEVAAHLLDLGLFHAALERLREVAARAPADPDHATDPDHAAVPALLARLAGRVPEPSALVEAVGRYPDEAILAHPDLAYFGGRARYQADRLPAAVALLRRVPTRSAYGLEARIVEAVAEVRRGRSDAAEASLSEAIDAVEDGFAGHEDPARMREIAILDLGRVRYGRAARLPREDQRRALEGALGAWRRVPLGSPLGPTAFFEETWALFALGEAPRALGHVHALRSPSLRQRAPLEALVVRATVQLQHCQWDATEAAVADLRAELAPLRAGVARVEARADTDDAAFELLLAARARRVDLPAAARARVWSALDERDLARHALNVASIDAERRRAARMDLSVELAQRVETLHARAREDAIRRAGARTRARLASLRAEIDRLDEHADALELELTTARRGELDEASPPPMGPPTGGAIWAIQGMQRWPFEGEWWPDEFPHYQQEVRSRCR